MVHENQPLSIFLNFWDFGSKIQAYDHFLISMLFEVHTLCLTSKPLRQVFNITLAAFTSQTIYEACVKYSK